MKNNDGLDLNIKFIKDSSNPGMAADLIAESFMSEYGRNENGYWSASAKNLLSLILYHVATDAGIKESERTLGKCMEVAENADTFPGVILRKATVNPEEKFLDKKLQTWLQDKNSKAVAQSVYTILDAASKG